MIKSTTIKDATAKGRSLLRVFALLGALRAAAAFGQTRPAEEAISPFGIGASALNAGDLTTWIPQMAELGIRDLRSVNAYWQGIEPQPGVWNWDKIDSRLKFLEQYNVHPGCLLIGNGKQSKLKGLPMDAVPQWAEYVRQVVAHTKGRITHFEIWNEPPNGVGKTATPADYAKIVAASYDAAKAANPDAQIGLAAKSVHVNYLEQVIKGGAKDHFDYITLHPYEVLGCATVLPGSESVYMHVAPTVRKMLAAQNPEKENVPIIFTEIGNGGQRGFDVQAHALVKAYVMGIAQGIECIQWFEGRDGDSGPFGLIDMKGKPKPSYTAMQQLILHLGRYPKYLGWVLLNDKHFGFVFEGRKGKVMATWAGTSVADTVDLGEPVDIVDPLTGSSSKAAKVELTSAPILIVGVPAPLVAQAQANKLKPFPWNGDYTDAESISVTMGAKNIEKGLHTRAGDAVAQDVVAYGGNARAGSVPNGTTFIVDPNFLSYTTVPIEISAVVRRDNANHPAALTLEYESTLGFKKLPPFDIPDNKEWHTIKWKIDDAQFVNMWAFNFRFNTGKYLIQTVTVTKLQK